MAKGKWMDKLSKLDGAVQRDYNPFQHTVQFPSPSMNFVFGNTWGVPLGYGAIVYGPPKGGKSLIANALIGQTHQDDPEAYVVKFNTEMREEGQLSNASSNTWGIDHDRYMAYNVNTPDKIFDYISDTLRAMVDDGMPLKLIVIDSLTGIMGRRAMNAEGIMTQQIGDEAKTIQDGLKQILETVRHKRIALLCTAHLRAEMDPVQQMRGKKTKMAAAWATQHFFEYFVYVEAYQNKDGKTDLLGAEFIDNSRKDLMDKGEQTGHKIRVRMEDSSVSPKGRTGIFTLNYDGGIINKHEEVYLLGLNRGIIGNEKRGYYDFEGTQWHGEAAILEAIKGDMSGLGNAILKKVKMLDVKGA